MGSGFQEQRHVRQRIPDPERLNIGFHCSSGFVRHCCERFVGRQSESFGCDFLPNRCVDALRVSLRRWKQVDDEQVDSALEQLAGLVNERLEAVPASFITG